MKKTLALLLTWFGRTWITATILVMLYIYFFRLSGTGDNALFHIGWVPIGGVPNPIDILWWIATAIIALPGVGALMLRDRLAKLK